jgi:hypothetical protein
MVVFITAAVFGGGRAIQILDILILNQIMQLDQVKLIHFEQVHTNLEY